MSAPAMLAGDRVYRIHWVLGTDLQRAVCHCGAERVFEEPVQLWDWLLAHPVGHDGLDARGLDRPAPPTEESLPEPRAAPSRAADERDYDMVVASKELVAAGVARLTLRHATGDPAPAWTPGSHIDLMLGDGLVRQYSLCGDPADPSTLQVAVLREVESRGGSGYVHEVLAEGRHVRVRGPRNHFPLEPAAEYLFIAGGIGITPIRPMVAEIAARPGVRWRLVYGGRTRASMAFRDELEASYPGTVQILPQDEVGLLDLAAILDDVPAGAAVYCCGPEPLLAAVENACASRPGLRLHVERFAPKTGATDGARHGFDIELAQSGLRIAVAEDTSILQAIEDAGIAVLSSCREGICGTCETAVLAGVPDHRDSILTPAEQDACDTMMICVSRSRSALLVLDR